MEPGAELGRRLQDAVSVSGGVLQQAELDYERDELLLGATLPGSGLGEACRLGWQTTSHVGMATVELAIPIVVG